MSSTRYSSNPNADDAPEKYLASGKLRGINIGMNIVARVSRVLPERERAAMLWLTNYAKLRDLTADALSDELDLDKPEIRRALTDPDVNRERFVRQVELLRKRFECPLTKGAADAESPFRKGTTFGDAYQPLANTSVRRKVRNAIKFGSGSPQIIEVIGKTRMGKSVAGAHEFFQQLDRSVWLHCPGGTWRDFLNSLCVALAIATPNAAHKSANIISKIEACFGTTRLRTIFVDEGHRLWPNDLKSAPVRIEFLRDLWEKLGVSIIIFATPQYSESLQAAMEENPRWSPGQWDGRVQRYHLSDTMSDTDLAAVARHHLGEQSEEIIVAQLVEQAKASEGFCGAMVKAIQRARFIAESEEKPLALEHIKIAQAELARHTRIQQLANAQKRGGKR